MQNQFPHTKHGYTVYVWLMGWGDHVICSASGPGKCELTLPKLEQKQIFMKQTFINVITVCHLRNLAIRSEPWLSWNQREGSHLLQQISITLWIYPAIKWILFPPSWFSKWGKKRDYSFSEAFKVPCVLLIVLFCNLWICTCKKRWGKAFLQDTGSLFSFNLQCCSDFGTGSSTSSTFETKLTTATWDLLSTVSIQSKFVMMPFSSIPDFP